MHNIIHPYTYMHAWHTTVQASGGGGTGQADRQTADSNKTKHTGGVSVWGGGFGSVVGWSAGRLRCYAFRLFVCLFVLACSVLLLLVLLTKVD